MGAPFVLLTLLFQFPVLISFAQDLDFESDFKKIFAQFRGVEVTQNSNLSSSENFRIEPSLSQDSILGLKINVKPEALNDPKVLLEILANIKHLHRDPPAQQPMRAWAEIYWNSLHGDIEAKMHLKKWQQTAINLDINQTKWLLLESGVNFDHTKIHGHFVQRVSELQSEILTLEDGVKIVKREAMKSWEAGEATRKQLETANEKLDDLIKKNDRKGVRKIIEAYLPLDSMGQIEKTAWMQWLDAIENPATNSRDTTLLFRGLDKGNRIFPTTDGGHALMATILEKNQGNYTRRMRSYRINREKLGINPGAAQGFKNAGSYGSISGSMKFHSGMAHGTPYISFSNLEVATTFAHSGIVAVKIDKRRILPNFMNARAEFESLVPLIVFPDEIVHVKELPNGRYSEEALKDFRKEVEMRLGRVLTAEEIGVIDTNDLFRPNFDSQSFKKYLEEFVLPHHEIPGIAHHATAPGTTNLGFFGKAITNCKKLFSYFK